MNNQLMLPNIFSNASRLLQIISCSRRLINKRLE